ncbi:MULTISPECIES: hypothetical protein [unclassified Arthrobacter]|uniref:hypothetical protein n=1 Tax=unclassified Arthrobacter TaxID=235627 RepID=UPI001CFFE70E|nr:MULTISPECIES: hypothetical protein [unclassified Arthrobacter]MCB5281485.1 hypothetical protein [Arthrobacter sp. ES1]WGZ79235.1 hypothetical protein QI450_15510 [Arthrobacter sp. EM1]
MGDPTTIALNLTFFGTLAVAFVMTFGLFLAFVATLVIAGLGRLIAVTVMALGRALFSAAGRTAEPVEHTGPVRAAVTIQHRPAHPSEPAQAAGPVRTEPALSAGWADAVAQADASAAARAKAKIAPAVKVTVRELPDPAVPACDVLAVAPLVESATDRNGQLGSVPAAFKKIPLPAPQSLLDTGSLASVSGRPPLKPLRASVSRQPNARPSGTQSQKRKAS